MVRADSLRVVAGGALLVSVLWVVVAVQNANAVVAASSKAMGVDNLTSITYSGTARNEQFGQSKAIGEPIGTLNGTQVTKEHRTITFAPPSDASALVLRATHHRLLPTVLGVSSPLPGAFNHNIPCMK